MQNTKELIQALEKSAELVLSTTDLINNKNGDVYQLIGLALPLLPVVKNAIQDIDGIPDEVMKDPVGVSKIVDDAVDNVLINKADTETVFLVQQIIFTLLYSTSYVIVRK